MFVMQISGDFGGNISRQNALLMAMPLYFFELCDGVRVPDEEGQEFATLEEAREEALKSARSMMREEILRGRLSLHDSIRIQNEAGELLDTIQFRDAVRIEE